MRAALGTFLLAGLTALSSGKAFVYPLTSPTAQSSDDSTSSRIAVPFGTLEGVKFSQPSEPSLVQTAELEYDGNNIATDAAWSKYSTKGSWYNCLMHMRDEQCGMMLGDTRTPPSAESVWQGDLRQTLLDWGWYDSHYDPEVSCDFRDELGLSTSNKIQTALQALGLSYLPFGKNGDNECFSVEHFDENLLSGDEDDEEDPFHDPDKETVPIYEQTYKVGDAVYPATGAYYRFAINRKGGAMFAQNIKKPQAAAEENLGPDIPEDRMPHLQRASDIMWSYWERNNPRPKDLHYYFVNYIRNEETIPLVARALRNHNMDKVPRWPGLELDMLSDAGEALLGSPIGSGIAHLLIQHKKTLGLKRIRSITIFRDNYPEDWRPEVQLLFKIMDVPLPEQLDPDTEMPDATAAKTKRMVPFEEVVINSGKNVVREHRMVVGL